MNTLINRRKVPPGGFQYRCPVCGYKVKNPLAPWVEVVREIRVHRRNNPTHRLSLLTEDIEAELESGTCQRVPSVCHDIDAIAYESLKTSPTRKGCSTCGRGKKSA